MSTLGAGFFGPTEGEKRRRIQGAEAQLAWQKGVHPTQPKRRRAASPWLPPLSIDPRLTPAPRRGGLVTTYIIRNGPGGMAFTYDDEREALADLGRYVVACNAMHKSQKRWMVLP